MNDIDKDFQTLFDKVPRRAEPEQQAYQDAYRAVREEWQTQLHTVANRRRQKTYALAVAAALLVSVAVLLPQALAPNSFEARISTGSDLYVDDIHQTEAAVASRLRLQAGQTMLARSPSSLMIGKLNLRLAADTEIEWQAANAILLLKGIVYIDTHDVSNMRVSTPYGTISDIGTQFLVRLADHSLNVSVRKGGVTIEQGNNRHVARAKPGQSAVISLAKSKLEQHYEPNSSERWDWIYAAGSVYQSKRVQVLLEQLSKELGKELRYASSGAQASVATMTIDGEIKASRPRDALEIITRSSDLRIDEDATHFTIHLH